MENKNKHWVEELFVPHFSADDFFSLKQPESLVTEKLAFQRAKRVEEIYKTAIAKFQEEKKLRRKDYLSKLLVQEDDSNLEGAKINISKEETEGDSACCGAANLDVGSEGSIKETEGHCIWNAKELAALRQETHKKHLEGISLKLQLSSLNAEVVELKAKCKKIEMEFEKAKQELLNSKKEVCSRTAHLEQLQRESLKKEFALQALKQDLHEKSASVRSLNEELHQAREEIQHLDLQNKDLHREFKKLKEQSDLGNKTFIEKVKLGYDLEIRKLQKVLEDVKKELNAEKLLHTRDLKALKLLRKHFLTQPLSDTFDRLKIDFL